MVLNLTTPLAAARRLMLGKSPRNSLISAGGYGTSTVVTLVSYAVLGRALSAEMFGLFAVLITIVGSVRLFDLGFASALTRRLAQVRGRDTGTLANVMTAALAFYIAIAGTIAAGGVVLAPYIVRLVGPSCCVAEVTAAARLAGAALAPALIIVAVGAVLRGFEDFSGSASVDVMTSLATSAVPALLAASGLTSLRTIATGILLSTSAAMAYGVVLVRRRHEVAIASGSLHRFKEELARLFRTGVPLAGASLAGVAHNQGIRLAVAATMGPSAAGAFHVALLGTTRLAQMTRAIAEPVLPASLRWATDGNTDAKTARYARFLTAVAAVGILPLVIYPDILAIWAGIDGSGQFNSAVRWITVGTLATAATQPFYFSVLGAGQTMRLSLAMLASPVVTYAIVFMLPDGGYSSQTLGGFGLAMSAGMATSAALVAWIWSQNRTKIRPRIL